MPLILPPVLSVYSDASAVEIISVVVALPPVCSGIHLRASDESTTLYLVGLIAFVGMACLYGPTLRT